MFEMFFGGSAPKQPTANELRIKRDKERREREAKIDNLLDIANWNRKMFDKTGDATYREQITKVEAELKRLAEEV
ncbi:hypothetical protein [Bacillus sp. JJ722]|uniref:hypothetical protein n=1 Tax=Bacillus sp. JJ722 TaxID=3122973 RepID=UPI002FFEF8F2